MNTFTIIIIAIELYYWFYWFPRNWESDKNCRNFMWLITNGRKG